MLKSLLHTPNQTPSLLLPFPPCGLGRSQPPLRSLSPSVRHRRARARSGSVHCRTSGVAEAVKVGNIVKGPIKIDVVITVKLSTGRFIDRLQPATVLDDIGDLLGMSILLELVSAELDQKSGSEKDTVKANVYWAGKIGNEVNYKGSFMVPSDFGDIGGVYVTNKHRKEIFLEDIVLTADETTKSQTISCKSWVHSKSDDPTKRIFFTSKCYLPSQTPKGLLRLRERELKILGGNGKGEPKKYERIYDYDTYNDLGNPEKGKDKGRPVLGGNKELPYPRRCRTGRPRTKTDPLSETRRSNVYVPRDEEFSEVKQLTFTAKTVLSVLPALAPYLETAVMDADLGFPYFTAIDKLFDEVPLPQLKDEGFLRTIVRFVPRLFKAVSDITEKVLLFDTPEIIERDKFSWFRDEEFTRQTLAGLNPCSIQLVTEFPLLSKLDPKVYGPPESKITAEVIEREIKGVMTANEALNQKRLFMLDYHDLLLPFVHKVRQLEGTTLYGSRALFFLMPDDTLRLIAIELTRPASPTTPQWKRVFTPCWNATGSWLWRLAKAHVCAHDSGYHQLVSHWLRTHCCTEPYIIATNRQLSAMHPIYQLLHPHFRYTMKINALAREQLVNGEGIIESSFSPGKYSMELSSVAYRQQWRFDMEALPADLIRRGMAVKDLMAEHGLRLTIKDYPYANDGLLIWSNIEQWVTDYVSHYYPSPTNILEDYELQGWWTEIRTKGHADKKDEPWWPVLNTPGDLTHILTTIIWVASGHHAAVNFGQYHYAGYFPNRPTIIRKNMPVEDETSEGFNRFWVKPEEELLQCFPSQKQAVVVMAVIDVLSNHSPDEEYIGGEPRPAWDEEPMIQAAFERFNGRMMEIEGIIDGRNADHKLMNRCGAGIVPYELLKPFSKPGVTGMGIPNSISI